PCASLLKSHVPSLPKTRKEAGNAKKWEIAEKRKKRMTDPVEGPKWGNGRRMRKRMIEASK
ncbi:hypothetical protein K443DRAFT_39570, partial [Laccaria amethystina LaAM-08-1]